MTMYHPTSHLPGHSTLKARSSHRMFTGGQSGLHGAMVHNDGEVLVGWFSIFGKSTADREAGLALIRHLHRMFAYQQLTMEIYNDAIILAEGRGRQPREGLSVVVKPQRVGFDEVAAAEYVLPALKEKQRIQRIMETEHDAVPRPAAADFRQPYDDFSDFQSRAQERTAYQHDGLNAWLRSEREELDGTRLDGAEQQSMTKALLSLNKLIRAVGLKPGPWLDLMCNEFNAIRESMDLPPMPAEEFRSAYLGGLEGKPARFFAR